MKKTLALILALMMVLSLALVSCSKEPEETEAPTDDFFNVGGDSNDSTDGNGEGDKNDDNPTISTGYTATNDTVYVLFDAILREDDKTSSEKIAEVPFGTALQRVEKSKKWSKLSYNGTTAYVANDLITTNKNSVTFTAVAENTTAKVTAGSGTLNLRKYPTAPSETTVIDIKDFNAACIIGKVTNDTEVKILSVSADGLWAKIECQAYAKNDIGEFVTELSTMTGYCYLTYTNYNNSSSGNNGGTALG